MVAKRDSPHFNRTNNEPLEPWEMRRCVCVLCPSKVFFSLCVNVFLISLHMFFKCLKSCYFCESYHHARRRQAANQRWHNQPHRNHLYLTAVKRLSIIVFDMQNRTQSQTFRAIISGQNIDIFSPAPPPEHFLAQLHLKHIQISHSGKSVGSLMLGSLGSLRVGCGLV